MGVEVMTSESSGAGLLGAAHAARLGGDAEGSAATGPGVEGRATTAPGSEDSSSSNRAFLNRASFVA
ncbi:hypothetical protein OHA72_50840 [Dactylosporangium sp. NBC_01737]|uniref:hypothetical protein n=1 Tax=Dactylosporangium sp. NBC_01737 TaxID=2975959 RepID=UPI002E1125A1|nr:hypothetical protein OHA72_50840 [Dactylosporangium sp. NBC_01737]